MSRVQDIPADLTATWIASPSLSQRTAALYELTKPRVNFLVVVTTAVGAWMAAGFMGLLESPLLFMNLLIGTALTAAGASVFNQYLERDADAKMPRTRNRPLPEGVLTPGVAFAFGLGLAVVGTAWLAFLVNPLTAVLGAMTLLTYVLLYTPLKRRTWWCTLVGAVPGAIPPMMGFSGMTGQLGWGALTLFALLFVWQMPHFYALALLYRDDYARGGFQMLPSRPDGLARTARQIVGFCVLLLLVSLAPTLVGLAGPIYAAGAVALGTWFLWTGIKCARTLSRPDARRLFIVSILYLPLVLGLLMLDRS